MVEVGQLQIDLVDDGRRVDAGRAAEQFRVILHQRQKTIMHGLQIGLDCRQVVGVDAAQRLGLGVVENRAELGEGRVRRIGVERRRQLRGRKVEPRIVVLDAQGLKHRIVLDGVDDIEMRCAQGGFGGGVVVDRARHRVECGRDVGEHLVDIRKLDAGKIVGRNIRGQTGLHELEISDVAAVRAVALIAHLHIVMPEPAFEDSGRVVEHVLEIEVAGVESRRAARAAIPPSAIPPFPPLSPTGVTAVACAAATTAA